MDYNLTDKDVLRRIAERGLARAQEEEDSEYCDIFQHILDELERTNVEPEKNSESRWRPGRRR
jgi:hypothetical protein